MNKDIPQQTTLLEHSVEMLSSQPHNSIKRMPVPVLLLMGCVALTGCNSKMVNTIPETSDATSAVTETTGTEAQAYNTEAQFSASLAVNDSDSTVEDCDISAEQLTMLAATNQARSIGRFCGDDWFEAVADVTWSCDLMAVAKSHSIDMATHNFFSHQGSNGLMVDERVTAAEYEWRTVGENIAVGQTSVTEVVDDWLQSPGHCVNIMNGDFEELGSWRVDTNNADYISYWTKVFAKPL